MIQDARKLPQEAQRQNRRIAFHMRELGYSSVEIAKVLNVDSRTVLYWFQVASEHSREQAIQGGERGGSRGRMLSPGEEEEIQKMMIGVTPERRDLPFSLWTREAVQALIRRETGVDMPISTVGSYLKRWDFVPQKPLKRAYEQDGSEVKEWLDKFPEIEKRVLEEGAEIFWGDEVGFRNDQPAGRSYAPKGRTPVRDVPVKRFSINMISAINRAGEVSFMFYKQSLTAEVMITFLEYFIRDAQCKRFLIIDNHPVHSCKRVAKWLSEHKDKVELIYLPAYSPKLNPDEYLNGDLKQRMYTGLLPRTQSNLEYKISSIMEWLHSASDHVKSYFSHPDVFYAKTPF